MLGGLHDGQQPTIARAQSLPRAHVPLVARAAASGSGGQGVALTGGDATRALADGLMDVFADALADVLVANPASDPGVPRGVSASRP